MLRPSMSSQVSIFILGFPEPLASRLAAEAAATPVVGEEVGVVPQTVETAAIFAFGPLLAPTQAVEWIDALVDEAYSRRFLVLAAGDDPEIFQRFIDEDLIHYLCADLPPDEDVLRLLSASRTSADAPRADAPPTGAPRDLLTYVRLLGAASSSGEAGRQAARSLFHVLEADEASCRFYDPEGDTLWYERDDGGQEHDSAAAGLTSFALRTASTVRLAKIDDDPRYDPEADNPTGLSSPRALLAAVPGRDGAVAGVLTALRSAQSPPFEEADEHRIEELAHLFAPILETWARDGRPDGEPALFRRQALDHHQNSSRDQRLLRLSPEWLGRTYRLLVAVFLAAIVYTGVARVHEYSAGPAVVRFEGDGDVTASVAGTATTVAVEAGQKVRKGDLLAGFYSADEAAELTRIRSELEARLLDRLRDPADRAGEAPLAALRAQETAARSRLEERSLRAPRDGIVRDVRLRPGQYVAPGQVVMTLAGDTPALTMLALLPGSVRPQIRPGMALRLELSGYPYAYQHLRVEEIGDEVLGPAEARRLLPPAISDALPFEGSVVLVRARLPADTFESDGRVYRFYDGMPAVAEVRTRSERLLFALVPGLKILGSDRHPEDAS